jgi:hypothetical protein
MPRQHIDSSPPAAARHAARRASQARQAAKPLPHTICSPAAGARSRPSFPQPLPLALPYPCRPQRPLACQRRRILCPDVVLHARSLELQNALLQREALRLGILAARADGRASDGGGCQRRDNSQGKGGCAWHAMRSHAAGCMGTPGIGRARPQMARAAARRRAARAALACTCLASLTSIWKSISARETSSRCSSLQMSASCRGWGGERGRGAGGRVAPWQGSCC